MQCHKQTELPMPKVTHNQRSDNVSKLIVIRAAAVKFRGRQIQSTANKCGREGKITNYFERMFRAVIQVQVAIMILQIRYCCCLSSTVNNYGHIGMVS